MYVQQSALFQQHSSYCWCVYKEIFNSKTLSAEILRDIKIIKGYLAKQKIYSISEVNLIDAKRFGCLYKNEES